MKEKKDNIKTNFTHFVTFENDEQQQATGLKIDQASDSWFFP